MRYIAYGVWMGLGIAFLWKGNPAAVIGCIIMAELQLIQKNQEK